MGRRALPPVIVLLSDGTPTDSWEQELNTFNSTGWGHPGRTVRIAIAIGHDANKEASCSIYRQSRDGIRGKECSTIDRSYQMGQRNTV